MNETGYSPQNNGIAPTNAWFFPSVKEAPTRLGTYRNHDMSKKISQNLKNACVSVMSQKNFSKFEKCLCISQFQASTRTIETCVLQAGLSKHASSDPCVRSPSIWCPFRAFQESIAHLSSSFQVGWPAS